MQGIDSDFIGKRYSPSRIQLIVGKTQISDVSFYLVKFYHEILQNATWIPTLEAYNKGRYKLHQFNRNYTKKILNKFPFINQKIIQDELLKEKNLEESEVLKIVKKLESHFLQKLKKKQNVDHEGTNQLSVKIQPISQSIFIDFSSTKKVGFEKQFRKSVESVLGRIIAGKHYFYLLKLKHQSLKKSTWFHFPKNQLLKNRTGYSEIFYTFNRHCPQSTNDNIFDLEFLSKLLQSSQSKSLMKKQVISMKKEAKQKKQIFKSQLRELEIQKKVQSFIKSKKKQINNPITFCQSSKIQKIIGKGKSGVRTFYLVKYARSNNYKTFKWIYLRKRNRQKKIIRLLDQFNSRYSEQRLPIIDPQYMNHKQYFLNLLFQSNRKIEKVLGKKVCFNKVFYLVKWQNQDISEFSWIRHDHKQHQILTEFNKKFHLKRNFQSCSYIDRQKILICLYNQKISSISSNKFEKSEISDSIEKELHRETKDLMQIFQEEATNIKSKFNSSKDEFSDEQDQIEHQALNYSHVKSVKRKLEVKKQEASFSEKEFDESQQTEFLSGSIRFRSTVKKQDFSEKLSQKDDSSGEQDSDQIFMCKKEEQNLYFSSDDVEY